MYYVCSSQKYVIGVISSGDHCTVLWLLKPGYCSLQIGLKPVGMKGIY